MDDIAELGPRGLFEHAHVGVLIYRWDTTIVYANPAALSLLHLRYEQLVGKDALDPSWHFVDETNRHLRAEEFPVNRVRASGKPLRNEVIGVVDGEHLGVGWFHVNAYPEGEAQLGAEDHRFIVMMFAEAPVDSASFSFRDIVENADDMIIVTEADDIDPPNGPRIVYVNRAFEKESGYSSAEIVGETPRILQGSLTDSAARDRIRDHLRRHVPVREKLLNYTKGGVPYWVEMNIVPLRNGHGELTHFAAIERNISEQTFHAEQLQRRNEDLRLLKENLRGLIDQRTRELRDANEKLGRLAFFDALTEIPNRRSFIDQAERQWMRASRTGQSALVGVVDIDHFKNVNDTNGHAVGDRLLVAIAECLSGFFRKEDAFGRIGGEEFAFCVLLSEDIDAMSIGERLREKIAQSTVTLPDGAVIRATASVGLVVSDPQACTFSSALNEADMALYRAKERGRNACVLSNQQAP